jgi:hypothetical protein
VFVHRCFYSAFSFSCAPVAHWDAFGCGSSHCISWYQIQLIPTTCFGRYRIALWHKAHWYTRCKANCFHMPHPGGFSQGVSLLFYNGTFWTARACACRFFFNSWKWFVSWAFFKPPDHIPDSNKRKYAEHQALLPKILNQINQLAVAVAGWVQACTHGSSWMRAM